jgi:hypothetical protein
MNRVKMFAVAVAAASLFAGPFVPVAFAGDNDRHGHRADYHDRGRGGYDGGNYRGGRHDDHDHDRPRGPRYAVSFHLDGGSTRHKAKDRFRAAEIVDELERLGVWVHVHDRRELHIKLRGERRTFVSSHEEAHLLARRLENWGFHASVSRR